MLDLNAIRTTSICLQHATIQISQINLQLFFIYHHHNTKYFARLMFFSLKFIMMQVAYS
jgi:hypothetical protein